MAFLRSEHEAGKGGEIFIECLIQEPNIVYSEK